MYTIKWLIYLVIFDVVNICHAYIIPARISTIRPVLYSYRWMTRLNVMQNERRDDMETTKIQADETEIQRQESFKKPLNMYDGSDAWVDDGYHFGGFDIDWELEKARRLIEGPAFAPLRMTLWQPPEIFAQTQKPKPGFIDNAKIFLNNALQLVGWAESFDGAPLVQGISSYNGTIGAFLSRIIDGNLVELAGGPLFLMLQGYYKQYGSIFKLTFGPKSFMIISDPVMARHILKENPWNYDKGILAEILEPVMGKGLIPADLETWKIRRKAIVPGFHKAWLNAMVIHLEKV
jgi:hypothetical protein